MKYLILFGLALAFVACIPCEVEAGCGLLRGWFPGKRVAQNVAERRSNGEGLFQKNGPVKRLARGRK